MRYLMLLLAMAVFGSSLAVAAPARLKSIDHRDGVVRIQLDGPTTWHTTPWRSANRYIVEVTATGATQSQQVLAADSPKLKAVRWAQFKADVVRIVLDMTGPTLPVVLSSPPADVIEIAVGAAPAPKPARPATVRTTGPAATAQPPAADENAETGSAKPEGAAATPTADIADITVERDDDLRPTRIVVRTDGATEVLPEWRENHLVLNLPAVAPGLEHIVPVNDPDCVRVYAAREKGHAAVVVDFTRRVSYSVATLDDGFGFAVSLDYAGTPAEPLPDPDPDLKALAGKTIVVDPGHGGRDTGTRGPFVIEKTVNLDVALRLERVLTSNGAKVIMTRRDDTLTPLLRRPAIAVEAGADAFVSIHCNYAAANHRGVEVWHRRGDAESRRLSANLYRVYLKATGFHGRGVKPESNAPQGGLAVLKHNTVPCALMELGFVNDAQEGRALAVPEWRQKAAEALAGGLARFMEGRN